MAIYIVYAVLGLIALFGVLIVMPAFFPARRPLPTESDYAHRIPGYWEWYYSTKYLNPIRRAAAGTDLEAHFRENRMPGAEEDLREVRTFTLRAVGDLMTRRDLMPPLSGGLWDEVGEYLFDADLVVGNLEFAVNENRVIEKLLRYSVTPSHARPLLGDERFGKFDVVSVANNHINDSLHGGIVSTCDYLDQAGIVHVGANRTAEERDQFPIIEVEGVKVAFLAYTFSTNSIPLDEGCEYGTNLVRFNALRERDYDPSLIRRHAADARNRGADLIVSLHHWGLEFEYYPPERIVSRAHDLLEAGIDIILGHHPHILNPAEWYYTRDGRRTLCFYSLGSITSWALRHPLHRMAEIVSIQIEKGTMPDGGRVVRPRAVTITPTYFHLRHPQTPRADHRIIPIFDCAASIEKGTPPSYLSPSGMRTIPRLAREYRRYFEQQAFAYR
ncbi:MAG: hypothetical protein GF344_11655 [Chitinivibrionales bacterium]|nr:hypothetical protein [Chitinivibrionales bacterium]MBD3357441.1 hypothetical protein [Chitinivibrionales bacterium]